MYSAMSELWTLCHGWDHAQLLQQAEIVAELPRLDKPAGAEMIDRTAGELDQLPGGRDAQGGGQAGVGAAKTRRET